MWFNPCSFLPCQFLIQLVFWPIFVLSFASYIIQHLICAYWYKTQNLKKRYGAQWALVTGASSGIGKSIAVKLARQGLNVVLVALGDQLLDATYEELRTQFPALQFRKVAADLGGDAYLPDIVRATDDIQVQVLFCNAGYLLTGFFYSRSLPELMANYNCNATSAVQITYHFVRKMLKAKLRGCVVYTSSAAACMPGPFSALYAATKAFLASFGASLAGEVRHYGIDVLVFFPSPVESRFYDKTHKLAALTFFRQFAVSPDALPDTVFASIGHTLLRDVGFTAIGFRMLIKVLDYNFISYVAALVSPYTEDFKKYRVEAEATLARDM